MELFPVKHFPPYLWSSKFACIVQTVVLTSGKVVIAKYGSVHWLFGILEREKERERQGGADTAPLEGSCVGSLLLISCLRFLDYCFSSTSFTDEQ